MADGRHFSRRQLLATTGAGAAAGLAGCLDGLGGGGGGNGNGNGDQDPADLPPVHFLTDYNNDPWQKKWEETLIPQFNEETGIGVDIEYSGFSGGGQENRLATLLQSGDPPGLSAGTMEQVADVWASDQLRPTTQALEDIKEVAGELTAPLFEDPSGDTFMFPHGYYVGVLHYREDIYEQLGLEVPTSWQGLVDNAKAIDESDIDIRGYGVSATKAGKGADEFQYMIATAGASELRLKDGTMDDEVPEAEVWFPEEETRVAVETMQELANYSPDPSGIGWASSLGGWPAEKYAQQWNLNMWPAGVAAGVNEKVAENTGVARFPTWEEGGITYDEAWVSAPAPDGHFPYADADNSDGAMEWMKWLYGDTIDRSARMYATEPTRFVPMWGNVLESDTFANYEHFGNYPSHLEGLQFAQQIVEEDYGNVEESRVLGTKVPEAMYYYRFFHQGEMVNQIIAGGTDFDTAYQQAIEKAEQRLAEGKEKVRPE